MIQSVDLPVMSQQHSGCYQILGMLCTCLCQMTSAIVLYNGQCGRLGWLPTPQQGKNASVEARGHCQLHCNLRLYRYRYGPLWLYPLSECVLFSCSGACAGLASSQPLYSTWHPTTTFCWEIWLHLCSEPWQACLGGLPFLAEPGVQLEVEGAKEEVGHWGLEEAGPAHHTLMALSRASLLHPSIFRQRLGNYNTYCLALRKQAQVHIHYVNYYTQPEVCSHVGGVPFLVWKTRKQQQEVWVNLWVLTCGDCS